VKRKAPRRPHVPVVTERKLGREKAWGFAYKNGDIEIDPRLKGLSRLEILLHEQFHVLDWEMSEAEVTRRARKVAKFLHANNVRIIEPGNQLCP
jgi:hypothetical protein